MLNKKLPGQLENGQPSFPKLFRVGAGPKKQLWAIGSRALSVA